MVTPRRDSVLAELRSLEAGVQKYLGNRTVVLASESYTGAQLLARVGLSLDAATRLQAAKGALADALANDRKIKKSEAAFLLDLKNLLRLNYSDSATTLGAFALEPRKKRPVPTPQEALVAVAKGRATRVERKTMGKRQKAAIKGNVSGVAITPVTTPGTGGGGEG